MLLLELQRRREPDDRPNGERVRRAYILALGCIAALSVTSFGLLNSIIDDQDGAAAVINVAGRQRMLSQRIGKLATMVIYDRTEVETSADRMRRRSVAHRLAAAVQQMERAHRGLMNGDPSRGLPGIASRAEADLYRMPGTGIDERVRAFLDDARTVLADPGGKESGFAAERLTDRNSDELLRVLNRAVGFYEAQAAERTARAETMHLALLAITLLALIAEALLIFRPLVAELKQAERSLAGRKAELLHRSRHDELTGLLNRHALRELVEAGLFPTTYAVIAIDLDDFKGVNDTHGHEAGDALLRDVGAALQSNLRDGDAAIRLGGDEFVVLVSIEEHCPTGAVDRAATRLHDAVLDTTAHDPARHRVSASLGTARFPDDGTTFDDVLANADIALYRAKSSGKNQIVRFEQALRDSHEARRNSEALVRECLERDGFVPHFQPQVDLRSGAVVGIEALARGVCPDLDILSPASFMETAEGTGLIVPLGKRVIAKAVREAAEWHRQGVQFGRLSVNASAAQLRDEEFPEFLRAELRRHGLPPDRLAVEVLETVLLDEANEKIVECCRAIRDLGVAIELDDFGTGYASIVNVERLGVERIKIDRSILSERSDRDLLKAMVTMASGLKLSVLAEGVETAEDEARLVRLGCFEAQGYHYARPMAADGLRSWLDERVREAA